ncbi:hypothetical protein CEUSTIGMA_g6970.t1 [Chlamydomonas eustigma]|uniref:Uncharacterized protein n=1 Tax=Chlamydomonas eustigma TaxID=1157962 RepID=A0A250X9E8_9CHLO|nr:hypothetical protein CEUSTIGMA_g6970.t1 [Chlamydomonas eustigma]|eukprot:GAX79529.1 hypothetical protein CEUSTIGMA_g6970.t1 [Chlamydomonas eustigma]
MPIRQHATHQDKISRSRSSIKACYQAQPNHAPRIVVHATCTERIEPCSTSGISKTTSEHGRKLPAANNYDHNSVCTQSLKQEAWYGQVRHASQSIRKPASLGLRCQQGAQRSANDSSALSQTKLISYMSHGDRNMTDLELMSEIKSCKNWKQLQTVIRDCQHGMNHVHTSAALTHLAQILSSNLHLHTSSRGSAQCTTPRIQKGKKSCQETGWRGPTVTSDHLSEPAVGYEPEGVQQQQQICSTEDPPNDFPELICDLCRLVRDHTQKYKARQVANSLWALSKLVTHLNSIDDEHWSQRSVRPAVKRTHQAQQASWNRKHIKSSTLHKALSWSAVATTSFSGTSVVMCHTSVSEVILLLLQRCEAMWHSFKGQEVANSLYAVGLLVACSRADVSQAVQDAVTGNCRVQGASTASKGSWLQDCLEAAMQLIPDMTPQAQANCAWALAILLDSFYPHSLQPFSLNSSNTSSLRLGMGLHPQDPQDSPSTGMPTTVQDDADSDDALYAGLRNRSVTWLEALCKTSELQMHQIPPGSLAVIAWAMAKIKFVPPSTWMDSFFTATHPLLCSLSSQDLANVAWAAAVWKLQGVDTRGVRREIRGGCVKDSASDHTRGDSGADFTQNLNPPNRGPEVSMKSGRYQQALQGNILDNTFPSSHDTDPSTSTPLLMPYRTLSSSSTTLSANPGFMDSSSWSDLLISRCQDDDDVDDDEICTASTVYSNIVPRHYVKKTWREHEVNNSGRSRGAVPSSSADWYQTSNARVLETQRRALPSGTFTTSPPKTPPVITRPVNKNHHDSFSTPHTHNDLLQTSQPPPPKAETSHIMSNSSPSPTRDHGGPLTQGSNATLIPRAWQLQLLSAFELRLGRGVSSEANRQLHPGSQHSSPLLRVVQKHAGQQSTSIYTAGTDGVTPVTHFKSYTRGSSLETSLLLHHPHALGTMCWCLSQFRLKPATWVPEALLNTGLQNQEHLGCRTLTEMVLYLTTLPVQDQPPRLYALIWAAAGAPPRFMPTYPSHPTPHGISNFSPDRSIRRAEARPSLQHYVKTERNCELLSWDEHAAKPSHTTPYPLMQLSSSSSRSSRQKNAVRLMSALSHTGNPGAFTARKLWRVALQQQNPTPRSRTSFDSEKDSKPSTQLSVTQMEDSLALSDMKELLRAALRLHFRPPLNQLNSILLDLRFGTRDKLTTGDSEDTACLLFKAKSTATDSCAVLRASTQLIMASKPTRATPAMASKKQQPRGVPPPVPCCLQGAEQWWQATSQLLLLLRDIISSSSGTAMLPRSGCTNPRSDESVFNAGNICTPVATLKPSTALTLRSVPKGSSLVNSPSSTPSLSAAALPLQTSAAALSNACSAAALPLQTSAAAPLPFVSAAENIAYRHFSPKLDVSTPKSQHLRNSSIVRRDDKGKPSATVLWSIACVIRTLSLIARSSSKKTNGLSGLRDPRPLKGDRLRSRGLIVQQRFKHAMQPRLRSSQWSHQPKRKHQETLDVSSMLRRTSGTKQHPETITSTEVFGGVGKVKSVGEHPALPSRAPAPVRVPPKSGTGRSGRSNTTQSSSNLTAEARAALNTLRDVKGWVGPWVQELVEGAGKLSPSQLSSGLWALSSLSAQAAAYRCLRGFHSSGRWMCVRRVGAVVKGRPLVLPEQASILISRCWSLLPVCNARQIATCLWSLARLRQAVQLPPDFLEACILAWELASSSGVSKRDARMFAEAIRILK